MDEPRFEELLSYNRETGSLSWRLRPTNLAWSAKYTGKRAGCISGNGYVVISIQGRLYQAHRIAWLLATGSWPDEFLDHINGVKTDNRLSNLRPCSPAENQQNMKTRTGCSSSFPGVTFDKQTGKWRAQIRAAKKQHNLGRFKSQEEAASAYLKAKSELHTFQPVQRGGHHVA